MTEKNEPVQVISDDFSDFYLSDTIAIQIEDPKNGEPLLFKGKPVLAHVFGPSTEVYERAQDRQTREATKRVLAAASTPNKKVEEADPDSDIKFLIAITDRFENFPFPGGVEAIYRARRLRYINRQVLSKVGDMGNFFKVGERA